jgi:hypothetical protein
MQYINKSWKVIGGIAHNLKEKGYNLKRINIYSILWIIYVLIAPFILLILWGILLSSSPNFSI